MKKPHEPKSGDIPFFPEEYKQFRQSRRTLLAIESNNRWRLLRVISVHRIDAFAGDKIQFEDEAVEVTTDDYLFVVAYSTSESFDTFSQLEDAVSNKEWDFESICQVCRTTSFPEYDRYIGFSDVTEEESASFKGWKKLFESRQVKIT